jgi:hypothetical protein
MMRIDLRFERPLTGAQITTLRLVLGVFAAVRRVRVDRTGFRAMILAETLGRRQVIDALAEEGLKPLEVTTSLEETADAAAGERAEDKAESVRAIGR